MRKNLNTLIAELRAAAQNLPVPSATLLAEFPVSTDSRHITSASGAGAVFVAMPPAVAAHTLPEQLMAADQRATYIANAIANGAGTVVCPARFITDNEAITWVEADDCRAALGSMLSAWYGTADLTFPLIAVTGTNGKTTCAYLLEHLFQSARLGTSQAQGVGVLGTVSYRWPGHDVPAPLTTPDCGTIHNALAAMRDAGKEHGLAAAIMEVSSHALDQNRVAGLNFSGALFTNLTQDHLDYHGDMESYFQAKRLLFTNVPHISKSMVINADDPYGRRLLAELPKAVAYGFGNADAAHAFLSGTILAETPEGLHLALCWSKPGQDHVQWELTSPLVGRHNAANLMGVMALGLSLGFAPADFACFHDFFGVSGRLERIPVPQKWGDRGQDVGIFVDYAHTSDALIRAQEALRDAGFARIITVFGCGGDRDRTKRPVMGRAVALSSDVAVVTSDNPRTEDPETIINDIMPGLEAENARKCEIHRESDRRKALVLAVSLLKAGDALLVAGKGHEPYQIIGTTKHPFSDQGILKELLSCV